MKKTLSVLPNVVFAREEDGALLYHPETGEVKILNDTGAFIYQLLDGTRSENEIVLCLEESFADCGHEDAERDVKDFLDDLRRFGLLGETEK